MRKHNGARIAWSLPRDIGARNHTVKIKRRSDVDIPALWYRGFHASRVSKTKTASRISEDGIGRTSKDVSQHFLWQWRGATQAVVHWSDVNTTTHRLLDSASDLDVRQDDVPLLRRNVINARDQTKQLRPGFVRSQKTTTESSVDWYINWPASLDAWKAAFDNFGRLVGYAGWIWKIRWTELWKIVSSSSFGTMENLISSVSGNGRRGTRPAERFSLISVCGKVLLRETRPEGEMVVDP